MKFEYKEGFDEEYSQLVDREFNKFAVENGVVCNYTPFNIVAKEENKTIGVLTGHSYYNEVHIGQLLVFEKYRYKNIGTKLIEKVEEQYKDKGFSNINLSTYNFQAPEFYKKCGFQVEFIRQNVENPKLTKYFFVKKI